MANIILSGKIYTSETKIEVYNKVDELTRERFAQAVFELRDGREYRTFSRLLGVEHTTVTDWEACRVIPRTKNLEKIANMRGESLSEFMSYLEGKQNASRYDKLVSLVDGCSRGQLVQLLKVIANRLENI
jgi:transcriptional regulator with XRE-family HTH domain